MVKSLHPKFSRLGWKAGVCTCVLWGKCSTGKESWVLVRAKPLMCCFVAPFQGLCFLICQVRIAACLTESAEIIWKSVIRGLRQMGRLEWRQRVGEGRKAVSGKVISLP